MLKRDSVGARWVPAQILALSSLSFCVAGSRVPTITGGGGRGNSRVREPPELKVLCAKHLED